MCRKKQGSALRFLFIYLRQNLFNIKKHLALVLKKIVHVLNSVFQTNLNKVVNIFCALSEWIRNVQIIQYFSTIKIWMRTLHGSLRRWKNWNVIKETLLFLYTYCKSVLKIKFLLVPLIWLLRHRSRQSSYLPWRSQDCFLPLTKMN